MEQSTKHTPGPWKVERTDYFNNPIVTTGSPIGWTIAEVNPLNEYDPDDKTGTIEANARLIAAAPELLAALAITRGQWIHSVNAEQCLAALAKAEGRPA